MTTRRTPAAHPSRRGLKAAPQDEVVPWAICVDQSIRATLAGGCSGSRRSVPRDDLALVAVKAQLPRPVTGAPPDQEFWTPRADRVVTAAASRGFALFVFRQL